MDNKMNLNTPVKTFIVKTLSVDPVITPLFGRNENKDDFFQDLLTLGVDFYELLELFINCEAVTKHSIVGIIDVAPDTETIECLSESSLRRMIPHWTASRYHTASIKNVINELREHISMEQDGAYVYNSNFNSGNRRAYNDMYVLIINDGDAYFFDINRKKAYRIKNYKEMGE